MPYPQNFHRFNLSQLLVLDPEKRLPLDEVQRHPWILKHCLPKDRQSQRVPVSKESRS